MSAKKALKVQTNLLPFHLHKKTVDVDWGLSIEEMVKKIIPVRTSQIDVIVTINGEVIPVDFWPRLRPLPRAIIGLHVVPAKGKGGGKNPLATILSVALMVAAPYIAGALTAGVIGVTGATSLATAQAVYGAIRIGVGLVGFLASSMLSSTPSQNNKVDAQPNLAESPTQFIEGASNQILKYGVVPINLGVNRMFPPQAALPYTQTVGGDQYVYQLFTYGYGNVLISERKIGETPIENYTNVFMDDRLNGDLKDGTKYYTNDIFQEGMNVVLSSSTGEIIRTTQANADEADIDITFGAGLTAYNEKTGARVLTNVQFEIVYAPTGTTDWTTGQAPKSFASQSLTIETGPKVTKYYSQGYTYDLVMKPVTQIAILDLNTGIVSLTTNTSVPEGFVRIATFSVERKTDDFPSGRVITWSDDRASSIPGYIVDNSSFVPSLVGLNLSISAGSVAPRILSVTDATAEAKRVPFNLKFPVRGQYDIKFKRITPDATSDRVRDVATLTAIRSITYQAPVRLDHISGTGMKILGTDQLNGSVDRYNVVVSTVCASYDSVTDSWVDAVSSNPADLYRYVLQNEGFIKRLPDNRIKLDKLAEWHDYCVLKGLSYNRVIDYETSVDDLLRDIAAAGMATPHNVDGNYSVIIDNERPDIVGMITPHNSWGYSGNINYPDIPDALRVQFRNEDKGFEVDERIVYADGYDENNAEVYERLEFLSCTNSDLAWFYGRMYFAVAETQPETHKWSMDFENLDFNRGSRVTFVNDSILVGVGSGRIKEFVYDDPDTPTEILGFILNDTVDIPSVSNFGVRIRNADGSGYIYHSLITEIGYTSEFTFTMPVPIAETPGIGSLCSFSELGKELDLIVIDIRAGNDQTAKITAVNYAPERFDAANGTIPKFDSRITVPTDLLPPLAPQLASDIQTDESVMLRNSDGSFTSRMVISLINRNESSIVPVIKMKMSSATSWTNPNTTVLANNLIVITGLQDGVNYDMEIRYQRQYGRRLFSPPILLNNVMYIGASKNPGTVTDFLVTNVADMGIFKWKSPGDIDIVRYVMKFSRLLSGATWNNMQVLDDDINETRASFPLQSGTYMIKAVDYLGNESNDAAVIINKDNGALKNVIELFEEQPLWTGTKTNCQVIGGDLYLIDPALQGVYEFGDTDLSEVYTSALSSALVAYGTFYNRIRALSSIRGVASIRGAGLGDSSPIRSFTSIRDISSIRGIDPRDWSVVLEMALSQDGTTFSAWEPFTVGNHTFRRIKFRLLINSFDITINPRIDRAEVIIDMPDRLEWAEDVLVPNTGLTVTYNEKFMNNPAVNITIQDAAVDDRIVFIAKDNEGFTIKVYNGTLATYVARTIDYQSSGYGRII